MLQELALCRFPLRLAATEGSLNATNYSLSLTNDKIDWQRTLNNWSSCFQENNNRFRPLAGAATLSLAL